MTKKQLSLTGHGQHPFEYESRNNCSRPTVVIDWNMLHFRRNRL